MGTLALIFAFGLFLYGLKWDRQQDRFASAALWWPTLWAMRCGSRGVDYWISLGGGRLDPVLIVVCLLGGLSVLRRRSVNWSGVFSANRAIFVFYAYMCLSVLWAQSEENPFIKLFRPLTDLVMALVVVTEPDARFAILTVFRRAAMLLIPVSVALVKYFPYLGRLQSKHWASDTWIGVTTHKNPLGQLCFMGAIVFLWAIFARNRRGGGWFSDRLPWVFMALTLYLMYGPGPENGRSTTAIMILVLAVVMFFAIGKLRDQTRELGRYMIISVLSMLAVMVVLDLMGTSLQAVVAQMQGKAPTLTDRTYLWADVIRIGKQDHPWLGSGYGSFFQSSLYSRLSPEVNNEPAQAHNGYLETFANLGLIGVALLLWVLLSSIRSASRIAVKDFEYGRLRLVLLVSVMIMNYAEATFPRGTHLWWFGFLVVALYAQPWVYWPKKQKRASVTVDTGVPESSHAPQAVPV